MDILGTIIIGLLAGIVAKALMPERDPGGIILTTLLGIAGALVAKYFGVVFGFYDQTDSTGLIASVLGAIIILAIHHTISWRTWTL